MVREKTPLRPLLSLPIVPFSLDQPLSLCPVLSSYPFPNILSQYRKQRFVSFFALSDANRSFQIESSSPSNPFANSSASGRLG